MFFNNLAIFVLALFLVISIFVLLRRKNLKKFPIFNQSLNVLSMIIFATIIILIIYGCKGPFETFENIKKVDHFSQEILEEAKNGIIDGDKIASYIKDNKLTKENINSIIEQLQTPVEDKKEDRKEDKKEDKK